MTTLHVYSALKRNSHFFVQHFCGKIRIFVATTCFLLPLLILCYVVSWKFQSAFDSDDDEEVKFALKAFQNLHGMIQGNRMWLDKAHSEQFLWFSIVVVTTDRRQFTLFYLFYFSFFCILFASLRFGSHFRSHDSHVTGEHMVELGAIFLTELCIICSLRFSKSSDLKL